MQADDAESAADPDRAQPLEPRTAASGASEPSTSYTSTPQGGGLVRRNKSALRRYVESFDQETMLETAR